MVAVAITLGQTLPEAPVPSSHEYLPTLVLVLLWIVIAAAVIGPIVRYVGKGPRSTQVFADDPADRR
jgi:hypothetical protein